MPEDSSPHKSEAAKSRARSQKRKRRASEDQSRGGKGVAATATYDTKSEWTALPGLSILSFSGPVETISNLPGRTRFRISAIAGREAARNLLIESLQKIKGVTSVEVNLISGSVLIHYEPEVITPEILFAVIIKLLDLESEFLSTPEPIIAKEFREIGASLNRTVYELTGGLVDFRTLLVISLAVFGICMFRKDPARAIPGGFTLLWWAYRSFASDAEETN
ncbi:MAG: HMA2 domain-containing protein [Thermodesulfobacteriota bacterium]